MYRKTRSAAVVSVLLAATVVAAAYCFVGLRATFDPDRVSRYYAALKVQPATPVSLQQVREAITRSAGYLRRANLSSGQFVYLVNMNPAVKVPEQYEPLRHAGTIYSMGMANAVLPDPANLQVMQRAVTYMRECCMIDLDRDGIVGLCDVGEVDESRVASSCLLGGAGLALLALTSLAEIDADSIRESELMGLARFGKFMQRWNGEFFARYVPSQGGRLDPGRSLYYPGEMALGWLQLHELRPDREWVDSAVEALMFLAHKRAVSGEAPSDHWALLATAKLFEIADREGLALPREALLNHAIQICHAMLEEGRMPPVVPAMEGALVPLGLVTPTATRLEGLLAARTILPLGHPIIPHVNAAIHRGVDFLIRAQIKDGPYIGALPFAIATVPDDTVGSMAAFNAQATEIRIDYVQHAMSAMVQYVEWIQ